MDKFQIAKQIRDAYFRGMQDALDIDDTECVEYIWESSATKIIYDQILNGEMQHV